MTIPFLLAVAISGADPSATPPPSLLRVSGRLALAHACVVDGLILTAAHVVDPAPLSREVPLFPLRHANGGFAVKRFFWDADLVVLGGEGTFQSSLAAESLSVGEPVWWLTPLWKKRKEIGGYRVQRARVTRFWGGVFFTDQDTEGGSSGGCVWNAKDEVVGVVTFAKWTEDSRESAAMTSVFGHWMLAIKKALARLEERDLVPVLEQRQPR